MFKRWPKTERLFAEAFVFLLLCLTGIIFCLDLFIRSGRPITYDGPTHLTTIAQFGLGLKEKQFPVTWSDGFASFGLPIPMIVQQTTSYLGGFFWLVTQNTVLGYNLVVLIGVISSAYFCYLFLKSLVKPEAAFIGSLLFMFAPYRIVNIYIRGALPELFATVWIPLLVLGLIRWLRDEKKQGLILFLLSLTFLILTHPLMLLPTALLAGPLCLFFIVQNRKRWITKILQLSLIIGLAFANTAYYLMPLVLEIKYFYYGLQTTHFQENHFLSWRNYLQPQWQYFAETAVGPRLQYFSIGSLEMFVIIVALLASIYSTITQRRNQKLYLLIATLAITGLLMYLTLPFSRFLYIQTAVFNNLQHPWRLLTTIIFMPPLILALLCDWLPKKTLSILTIILIVLLIPFRFPQLYGKNFIMLPSSAYTQTIDNLHGTYLNTIWSGDISDYKPKAKQLELIGGTGTISDLVVKNGYHSYRVYAETEVRIIDHTFYFPGWEVIVDGQPTAIEFQDTNYRGLITYTVPAGNHEVIAKFGDTKVRLLGKLVSALALITSVVYCFFLIKTQKASLKNLQINN